jgi:hypothetical protein
LPSVIETRANVFRTTVAARPCKSMFFNSILLKCLPRYSDVRVGACSINGASARRTYASFQQVTKDAMSR